LEKDFFQAFMEAARGFVPRSTGSTHGGTPDRRAGNGPFLPSTSKTVAPLAVFLNATRVTPATCSSLRCTAFAIKAAVAAADFSSTDSRTGAALQVAHRVSLLRPSALVDNE